jgi:hypothetical protein
MNTNAGPAFRSPIDGLLERLYAENVDDPHNGLRTMTLPFEGGLELTVRAPS